MLPFCRFQRQRCIKILCPKDPDFYTPLALKTAKGQHLPALVVYKNLSPIFSVKRSKLLVLFLGVGSFNMHAPYILSADDLGDRSLEFCRKPYILERPTISQRRMPWGCGKRRGVENLRSNHLSFWRFFPCFTVIVVQYEVNPCDRANCGLVGFGLAL